MAPIVIAILYFLMFLVVKSISALDMNNELRLAFNIIGGISALVLPIFLYVFLDVRLTQRALNKCGKKWCQEQGMKTLLIVIAGFFLVQFSIADEMRKEAEERAKKMFAVCDGETNLVRCLNWIGYGCTTPPSENKMEYHCAHNNGRVFKHYLILQPDGISGWRMVDITND